MTAPRAVTVRRAIEGDARAIATVHVQSWRDAYVGHIDQAVLDALDVDERTDLWTRIIDGTLVDAGPAFVAELDGEIVGFVNVRASRDADAPASRGELVAIYSIASAWDAGVGAALMASAVEELTRQGFADATLWVLASNERARRFYERAGWHADGTEQPAVVRGARIHEVRYVRSL